MAMRSGVVSLFLSLALGFDFEKFEQEGRKKGDDRYSELGLGFVEERKRWDFYGGRPNLERDLY